MTSQLLDDVRVRDFKAIARAISLIENGEEGADEILQSLSAQNATPVIGFTGPPGAGKSTLLDALLQEVIAKNETAAIVAVDPTSPFAFGAILGDRIRMSRHFDHPNVFIRSLATRGALGGLTTQCDWICHLLQEASFDHIFVETVGVGQAEVDVATTADVVVVVLAPEAGDDIQAMKAGLLEIADIIAVNKADLPRAEILMKHLNEHAVRSGRGSNVKILKTVAQDGSGVAELTSAINKVASARESNWRSSLITDKVYRLIRHERMRDVDHAQLKRAVNEALQRGNFNMYRFAKEWASN